MNKENRIKIVNEIIKEIAIRGRRFFYSSETKETAFIFQKNNRLNMKSEFNYDWLSKDIYLHQKYDRSPRNFQHGGTMWGLTMDFKEFIMKGGDTNHNNGYGGLYCTHWGYDKADMEAIQNKAKELGYLK